jgi:hypothetical protein
VLLADPDRLCLDDRRYFHVGEIDLEGFDCMLEVVQPIPDIATQGDCHRERRDDCLP